MYRRRAKKRFDKKFFSATANKVKSVNLSGGPMRGGIRL